MTNTDPAAYVRRNGDQMDIQKVREWKTLMRKARNATDIEAFNVADRVLSELSALESTMSDDEFSRALMEYDIERIGGKR